LIPQVVKYTGRLCASLRSDPLLISPTADISSRRVHRLFSLLDPQWTLNRRFKSNLCNHNVFVINPSVQPSHMTCLSSCFRTPSTRAEIRQRSSIRSPAFHKEINLTRQIAGVLRVLVGARSVACLGGALGSDVSDKGCACGPRKTGKAQIDELPVHDVSQCCEIGSRQRSVITRQALSSIGRFSVVWRDTFFSDCLSGHLRSIRQFRRACLHGTSWGNVDDPRATIQENNLMPRKQCLDAGDPFSYGVLGLNGWVACAVRVSGMQDFR
jgi:hypothetical protein